MATYFFDSRAHGRSLTGSRRARNCPAPAAAHEAAVEIFVGAIHEGIVEGNADQRFAVEVGDHLGPVLQVSAVLASNILRKQ